ncbi:PH domain-containing protein [Wukongibacter baidiensis]|uniref:PH domain-containing protein n=1 Tax=Wukongibacter baidiensis TaxID=1723361 RepID=UPI003D7F94D1
MNRYEGERNHLLSLLARIIINGVLKQLVIVLVLYLILISKVGWLAAIGIILVYLGVINISYVLSWRHTYFYIKDDKLFFQKGFIKRIRRDIPLDKINTIDLSQNLLEQITGLSRVKIDTESILDTGSELILILGKDRANKLQQQLLGKNESNDHDLEVGCTYDVSISELIRYSLLSNGIIEILLVLWALYERLDDIGNVIGFNRDAYLNNAQFTTYRLLGLIGLSLAIGFIAVLVRNMLRYSGFQIRIEPKTLKIRYGLLEKKNYSFDRRKIKGIHIKQSMLMQWFHKYTIEIESIGYGDEGNEKAVLYPYCNEEVKVQILNELLPSIHQDSGVIHRPPQKSFIHFILSKVLVTIIGTIILAYNFGYAWVGVLVITIAVVHGYMIYRNTALGMKMNRRILYASRGAFKKKQSYINGNVIQSICQSQHYFQKQKGICNYSIITWGKVIGDIKVKHMDSSLFEAYVKEIQKNK